MTLQEAKEILWEMKRQHKYTPIPGGQGALTTGIEAIERLQVGRNNPGFKWNDPLPSETSPHST